MTQRITSTLVSVLIALAFFLSIFLPVTARADENGISFWLPGLYGSLAATPQQPGWSFAAIYYHTSVSAGGGIAAPREVTLGGFPTTLNLNLNANVMEELPARHDFLRTAHHLASKPDLTLTINRSDLELTMIGTKTLEAQIADGTAKVQGDPSILKQLGSTMVEFDPRFEIMPGTKGVAVVAKEDPYEARDVRQPIAE